ncbi:MAG: hypothetical protein IJ481_02105 [Alphaproteobacteria bacterium]|nr:hypothetical protein [Alphaproteobacteria bacterium]
MNIRCPYCGCSYSINESILKEPIGNEQLGYGWWLRCYKCHKKWWLKHSSIEQKFNSPLRANREESIKKLSKLVKPKKKRKFKVQYLLLALFIAVIGIAFCKREAIMQTIVNNAIHIAKQAEKKMSMKDVRYFIEGDKITVFGKVSNDDTRTINLSGINVNLTKDGNVILAWKEQFDVQLIPGQELDFETASDIKNFTDDIQVEVSVF